MPQSSQMSRIDQDALPKLWAAGVSSADIAERFGVKYPAVNRLAIKMGLPPRGTLKPRGAKPGAADPADPEPLASLPAGASRLDVDVMLTKGRWAALADVARDHGISQTRALQIWHRLRV